MKVMQTLAYVGLLVLGTAVLSGCGWVDQLRSYKGEDVPPEGAGQTPSVLERQLGLVETGEPEAAPADPAALPETEKREVVLYFLDPVSQGLTAETRAIPKQEGLARATLNQLLAGPVEEDLLPAIPTGVALRDINVADGQCTVDLAADPAVLSALPESQQVLALYSQVDTLSQFDSVQTVRVLVNGAALTDFAGVDVVSAAAGVK